MPDGGASLPGWPLLMDETMAARFTGYTRRDFKALVAARVLPPGRIHFPVPALRWHRAELQGVLARLYGLDGLAAAQQDEEGRQAARDALRDFTPPTGRRAPAARSGHPKA